MNKTFYGIRNSCDSIIDYPTIKAEILVINIPQNLLQAKIENNSYDIEFGNWSIGDKFFNIRFYYNEAELYAYGNMDITQLNEDGTIK